MKITGRVEVEAVTDVRCDVCDRSTRLGSGNLEYGTLHAHWGYGALHDGERYEVHLCEACFFATLAYLKQERRTANMFEDDPQRPDGDFGLAAKDDFFRDGR
ncbi:hypothetical protein HX859_09855 [Pseudomonas gingeri]|uniref:hypothetical protein n=1 Tax=Pseudomonas gingeri TaxID=117681 RepID=UPI0015A2C855|nr:hypothetical protein [Pseudomonas gingeri]NVZ75188.1 hypothetical protein [Pseudomonas gingeri]